MRTLLFLCFSAFAFSQTGFVSLFDSQLQSYLKLTQAQFDQLQRGAQENQQMQALAAARLNIVNQEIAVETLKPSPNPLELGLRYQELETICREQDGPRLTAHQRQLSVLSQDQRALLPGLSEAQSLSSLSFIATSLFSIPIPLPIPSLAIVILGLNVPSVYTGSSIPVELALYLNLTPAQVERMQSSLLAHQRFVSARNSRSIELNAELEAEFRRDLPAPANSVTVTGKWNQSAAKSLSGRHRCVADSARPFPLNNAV